MNSDRHQIALFGGLGWSLPEARAYVKERRKEGVSCPCCGQYCRIWKRKLNAGMAAALVWLVARSGADRSWVHVAATAPQWLIRSRELAKLQHWGLIQQRQKQENDSKRRTSGVWRPTIEGREFALGASEVPQYVYLYLNEVEGYSVELIGIAEALGDRFDYRELIRAGAEIR